MKLIVNVTEECIEKGKRASIPFMQSPNRGGIDWVNRCPIAEAFKLLGYPEARVALSFVYIKPKTKIKLPKAAMDWRAQFDGNFTGEPFTFEVEIPE